ncbi:hypothetical protein LNQ03_08385 [Klebsiella pneumoniae subsp. pneumoniae]|nr:hypothetical protein [Klebsiella pneumoniae subsp. pneumoniae]
MAIDTLLSAYYNVAGRSARNGPEGPSSRVAPQSFRRQLAGRAMSDDGLRPAP